MFLSIKSPEESAITNRLVGIKVYLSSSLSPHILRSTHKYRALYHEKKKTDFLHINIYYFIMLCYAMFQQATATCHKNKITVYFESHSSLYTHGNEASVHPSTEAT